MNTVRNVVTKPVEKHAVRRGRIAAVADGRHARSRNDHRRPPTPGPGELVIRRRTLAMSGVHLALVTGTAGPGRLPSDGTHLGAVGDAGTVVATGDGVTRFAVGDEVFGRLRAPGGAWTPYVLTDADGPHVELRPDALEPVVAAALVEGGLTAKTIARAAGVQPGQTALVIGPTGRVGMVLVPLLVEAGVSVIATATPADAEYVRSLGAEAIEDGAGDGMEAIARHPDVDLLVDLVNFAGPYFATARAVLCSGTLVGAVPGPEAHTGPPGPGIPRIQLSAEPGDLLELAQRALDDSPSIAVAA